MQNEKRGSRKLAPNPNRFETRKFEASHGRQPRGRGNWAFEFTYCDGAQVVFFSNNLYSRAKADAIRQSRERFGARAWRVIDLLP